MADLENPITTQEDLDAIISERLKRKDEQMAKKYADYDDLRKSSEESAATIADLQKQRSACIFCDLASRNFFTEVHRNFFASRNRTSVLQSCTTIVRGLGTS